MSQVIAVTNAFCNAATFRAGMAAYRATAGAAAARGIHLIVDQHWPLNYAEMREAIEEYRRSYPNVLVLDPGANLGLHGGLNYALRGVSGANVVVLGLDPDERPLHDGWLDAMCRVLEADHSFGWLSLASPPCTEHMDRYGARELCVAGEHVRVPGYALMNAVVAWPLRAIRDIGLFDEPWHYYGGLEMMMHPRYIAAGYKVGWMRDYGVTPISEFADATYREYKRAHVGFTLPQFHGSFEEWLNK